jgi:hypothetical protein
MHTSYSSIDSVPDLQNILCSSPIPVAWQRHVEQDVGIHGGARPGVRAGRQALLLLQRARDRAPVQLRLRSRRRGRREPLLHLGRSNSHAEGNKRLGR